MHKYFVGHEIVKGLGFLYFARRVAAELNETTRRSVTFLWRYQSLIKNASNKGQKLLTAADAGNTLNHSIDSVRSTPSFCTHRL